jgi:hypothetical protein
MKSSKQSVVTCVNQPIGYNSPRISTWGLPSNLWNCCPCSSYCRHLMKYFSGRIAHSRQTLTYRTEPRHYTSSDTHMWCIAQPCHDKHAYYIVYTVYTCVIYIYIYIYIYRERERDIDCYPVPCCCSPCRDASLFNSGG